MKVCWVGSISVIISWARDGLVGLLDGEEGLGHLAGEALVGLRRVERDVLVPRGAGGGELAAALGGVVAGRRCRSCRRRWARRTRAWARAAQAAASVGLALVLASAVWTWVVRRSTASVVAAGAAAVRQGVTDAAGEAARADAEAHEAHEHEQGEAEVDDFDGAAAAAASQVEQHGGGRGLVLIGW